MVELLLFIKRCRLSGAAIRLAKLEEENVPYISTESLMASPSREVAVLY